MDIWLLLSSYFEDKKFRRQYLVRNSKRLC